MEGLEQHKADAYVRYLKLLMNESMRICVDDNRKVVTREDVEQARRNIGITTSSFNTLTNRGNST